MSAWLAGLLLLASVAAAVPAVQRGVSAYEAGDFAGCRAALEPLVAGGASAGGERVRALEYLAACSLELRDVPRARTALAALASEAPDHRLSPATFVPELIALAESARAEVARPRPPPPLADEPRPEPVRLLVGVWALADVAGRSLGGGADLGVGWSRLELRARVLAGEQPGFGLEAGLLLGSGAWVPRVGVRGSLFPGLGAGGGAVLGARAAITGGLSATADVAAELYSLPGDFRAFAVAVTAGLSFDLTSPWREP